MQREHFVWLPRIGKALSLLLSASLVAALDTAVVFRLPSAFASVNLPLVATLAATLFIGSTQGVALAFVLGVLCDVLLANALGARSIPLVVFAAVVGLMEARFSRDHPLTCGPGSLRVCGARSAVASAFSLFRAICRLSGSISQGLQASARDQRRPVGRLPGASVSLVAVRRPQICNGIGMISKP